MTKKRIFISTALASTTIAITGAVQLEHCKISSETQESCLPVLLQSEKTETQERIVTELPKTKSVTETTTSNAPEHKVSYKTHFPCETTVYIDSALPVLSESAVSLEEIKPSTDVNESFTPSEQTTLPPKPSQPQHGDINEKGEMYINGFGWIAFEGTNSCEYSPDMYTNGNKIGYFG